MWTGVVVVLQVGSQHPFQMCLTQHDHVVRTLSAQGTDHPFAIGILPGSVRCDQNFIDPHAFHAVLEIVAVDVVAIANEKTWGFLGGELGGPFGVGIRGHVEVMTGGRVCRAWISIAGTIRTLSGAT